MAKSKKTLPKKYVKLGPLPNVFADPYSRFKIIRDQVKELATPQEKSSGKIKAAIRGGHLVAVTEREYQEYVDSLEPKKEKVKEEEEKELTLEEILTEKTKADLTAYYKDTFDVGDEEIEAFSKLKHPDMVIELLELEKEAAEAEAKKKAEEE